jgi:hypothetical protein
VSISDRLGHGWVASAARLAGPLTGLVCFSLPTCLPTNTSPHWMTSERSIHCLAWFATRSAAAAPEHPTKGSDDFLAQYQHEQLSRHGKSKQNANVSRYGQLSIFISFMMVLTEEVKAGQQLPLTS